MPIVLPTDDVLLAIREPLTTSLRRGTPLVWASGDGRERRALLGWGERFRATARGPERFAALSAAFREHVVATRADGGPAPLAFVTVTFSPDSATDSVLVVPDVVGRWHSGQLELPAAGVPEPSEPAEFEELDFRAGSLTREQYRRAVARAVGLIADGEVEKIVLARDLEAVATHPIDLPAVLARLQYANPESWTFHVDGMFGSTPSSSPRCTAAPCTPGCSPAPRR